MKYSHNKSLVQIARNLRGNMTKEERHLWYDFLREYPVRFQRQKIIGEYVADFYCASANLIVELDGSQHYEEQGAEHDRQRTEFLESLGLTVLRFPNSEVNRNFTGVCEYIDIRVKNAVKAKPERE